ncbi:hypothetical protein SDC9_130117 [bioreactor metagenome]|uniref:Uncharacterized protein n=1 Tax=bioreactor metagenome TaxID=1076179 RepID=A0A645D1F5_9ZZZZ
MDERDSLIFIHPNQQGGLAAYTQLLINIGDVGAKGMHTDIHQPGHLPVGPSGTDERQNLPLPGGERFRQDLAHVGSVLPVPCDEHDDPVFDVAGDIFNRERAAEEGEGAAQGSGDTGNPFVHQPLSGLIDVLLERQLILADEENVR